VSTSTDTTSQATCHHRTLILPPLFRGEVPAHSLHILPRAYLITPQRLTPAKAAAESPTVSRTTRLQRPTLKSDAQLSTVLRAVPLAAGGRDTLLLAVLWRSPLDAVRRPYGPGIAETLRCDHFFLSCFLDRRLTWRNIRWTWELGPRHHEIAVWCLMDGVFDTQTWRHNWPHASIGFYL
jgi:hypothetical protein